MTGSSGCWNFRGPGLTSKIIQIINLIKDNKLAVHFLGVMQFFWLNWIFSAHGNWVWTKNV